MRVLKRGVGEHLYLMFAGRSKRVADSVYSGKPHGVQKVIPLILLLLTAFMMGFVLWRQIFSLQ
ncbi:MAG: hypothetical protein V4734_06030 [Terriglobus sp.]